MTVSPTETIILPVPAANVAILGPIAGETSSAISTNSPRKVHYATGEERLRTQRIHRFSPLPASVPSLSDNISLSRDPNTGSSLSNSSLGATEMTSIRTTNDVVYCLDPPHSYLLQLTRSPAARILFRKRASVYDKCCR